MSDIVLKHTEALILKTKSLYEKAGKPEEKKSFKDALAGLYALASAIMRDLPIFGLEPWHSLCADSSLESPAEMLLRLRMEDGRLVSPYPLVMVFYQNDMTADIDLILFLLALRQFRAQSEEQVSINLSARSFRDTQFVKAAIAGIESLSLTPSEKIIIEIHESMPHLSVNKNVLNLFHRNGVEFSIDDVGLHMVDIMRLSEFEGLARYIKIDRKSVMAKPEEPYALEKVIGFVKATLPDAVFVAEGVRSAEHAAEISKQFPEIKYVQGMYLPSREDFRRQLSNLQDERHIASAAPKTQMATS